MRSGRWQRKNHIFDLGGSFAAETVIQRRFEPRPTPRAGEIWTRVGDLENALFGSGEALWLSPSHTTILPAKCLVLILKPGECVLKMLRIKIGPILIPDIEIRINRLHREKAAQSTSSTPAYN